MDNGGNLHFPTPTPLLTFDHQLPPSYKFLSLPSLLLPLKSKMVAIISFKKILNTHLPKLCLLCRLRVLRLSWSPQWKGYCLKIHFLTSYFTLNQTSLTVYQAKSELYNVPNQEYLCPHLQQVPSCKLQKILDQFFRDYLTPLSQAAVQLRI